MRVFYYHTVDESPSSDDDKVNSNKSSSVLGSSEHTDWGSLTVVWQDQVGGLQTFCHACEKFHDVTPPPSLHGDSDHNTWDFVVHVGDLTSICLNLALMEQDNNTSNDPSSVSASRIVWPSPKHRVLSPTKERRLSLVYFAYPPACATMQRLQKDLHGWCRSTTTTTTLSSSFVPESRSQIRVPWEDYYLLRNQSSHGQDIDDPHTMYEKLAALPIDAVLQEKWNQVQR